MTPLPVAALRYRAFGDLAGGFRTRDASALDVHTHGAALGREVPAHLAVFGQAEAGVAAALDELRATGTEDAAFPCGGGLDDERAGLASGQRHGEQGQQEMTHCTSVFGFSLHVYEASAGRFHA